VLLRKQGIRRCFFPLHLSSVSALPCERGNPEDKALVLYFHFFTGAIFYLYFICTVFCICIVFCNSVRMSHWNKRLLTYLLTYLLYAYNTVQLLQRSRLPFSRTMPPTAPSWAHWLQDLGNSSYSSVSVSRESKRLKKSSCKLVEFWQCRVKTQFSRVPVLRGSVEAQVIWGGIVKRLLIASVTFLPKISKSIHVCQSYSKPKVGRFLRHSVCDWEVLQYRHDSPTYRLRVLSDLCENIS